MEKRNSGKATWDAFALQFFLDVCIEEEQAHNQLTGWLNSVGYANLIRKLNERTKENCEFKQFKNRWKSLKMDYNFWKSLNQQASGLGRDPITKTIVASDDWGEIEIKYHLFHIISMNHFVFQMLYSCCIVVFCFAEMFKSGQVSNCSTSG